MTNPTNLKYCKIYGNFKAFVADTGADSDDLPDFVPMSGYGKIWPNVEIAKNIETGEKSTYFNSPINIDVDIDGDISHEGVKYVMVLATSPNLTPTDFTYSILLTLWAKDETKARTYGPYSFEVTPDGELDITDAMPVDESAGVPIITGPQGPQGVQGPQGIQGVGIPAGGTALQYVRKDAGGVLTEWATLDKTSVGLPNVDNTSDATKPISAATQTALNAKEPSILAGTTAQYLRGDKTWQALNKAAVGLANVDNTSDAAKPVSSAVQTALNAKEPSINAGLTSQYWRGDKSWQPLDKTSVGLSNVDNTSDAGKPISTAAQAALDAKAPLASPTFTGTVSGVSKAMVGLSNVDNTSDLNKPVSTATQTALNGKEGSITAGTTLQYWRGDKTWQTLDKSAVGLANVDNTSDANKPISSAVQTALNAKAPLASPTFTGTVSGITKSMVGLANVDNTSDVNKPVSTAQQTAMNAFVPRWAPSTSYTAGQQVISPNNDVVSSNTTHVSGASFTQANWSLSSNSYARGLVYRSRSTTAQTNLSTPSAPYIIQNIASVTLKAGRHYRITWIGNFYTYDAATTHVFGVSYCSTGDTFSSNAGLTQFTSDADRPNAAQEGRRIKPTITFSPTTDMTVQVKAWVQRVAGTSNITISADSTNPLEITVEDLGSMF